MKKNNPIVDVRNMSVRFGDFYAVRDIYFSVFRGEIFGFLGANGAGKTTTIRVLCGLLPASLGTVIIDGAKFIPGREDVIKQKVGYMSQRFTLYDGLSVAENFDFAAALRGLDTATYIKQRTKLLDFIGFDRTLSVVVKNLPGGIKQEIALCVALLHNPAIIFLDEPTAGVAPVARQRFWKIIRDLAAQGKTIFVTTHYMDEAENCHRIALMRAGEIIATGSPAELKQRTFGANLYKLTPRHNNVRSVDMDVFDMFEPYGAHYHVRFRDGVNVARQIKKLSRDFVVVQIPPSLEDVFIRLVEGQNR
ncbi:MAG: ABC transporter ATP-binding protein [Alphaproteobacteria bacterium]|nr:ABC transporter ATP-binding protein [Alphaproteobacteria bacterium]